MRFTDSPVIELPVGNATLSLQQDNGSLHVGTSVWPSSLVLVKFLDRWINNNNKNNHSFHYHNNSNSIDPYSSLLFRDLRNKRAIELGSGCGPAGMGLALLLPLLREVVLTDVAPVLPALRRNLKRNRHLFPNHKSPRHAQLYWQNPAQIHSLRPPFHLVVAADVVYLEDDSTLHLVSAMDALVADDGVVLLGYQLRSPEAHALFWERCARVFHVLKVPKEDLHPDYAYDDTDVFLLTKKKIQMQNVENEDPNNHDGNKEKGESD